MHADIKSLSPTHAHGYIGRIDPRARIAATVFFSITTAAMHEFTSLGIALTAAVFAATLSGVSARTVLKRLSGLNLILLVLVVTLPFTKPGTPLATFGPLSFSKEGFLLSTKILMQANALMLAVISLFGTIEINTLGHALSHLRVPDKLAHLLLFTVRYLDVLHQEYIRLRTTMKARGFRPQINRHTYRTFGNLLGMLFVRSFDRAERILAAMKCRGFQGRFFMLDHFTFQRQDACFCFAAFLIISAMSLAEWL